MGDRELSPTIRERVLRGTCTLETETRLEFDDSAGKFGSRLTELGQIDESAVVEKIEWRKILLIERVEEIDSEVKLGRFTERFVREANGFV